MAFDVHQAVTDQIVATLEAGTSEQWQCPWHRKGGSSLPVNALTGRAYRGINTLMLWCAEQTQSYGDPRWATYKQWAELGAQVRKGERSTLITFFKELGEDEDGRRRVVARASYGFNASQVEGAPEAGEPLPASEWVIPEVFEGFVERTGADVLRGGEMACYIPDQDLIRIPSRSSFHTAHGYASTMAHELVHWSGAKGRLDRELSGRFRSHAYAAEELVAELGSAFLMAELGLEATPHPTHASYIASWISLLRSDPKAIFTAASAASKAAGYLTSLQSQMADAA
ncbi:ArdC family protein [Methylobacterium sp. SD21]|uniref:ArdC family protein n=1 Tax=Methylobacterium litchii TaxID=3138810 RepID=UPI00313A80BC